MHLRAPVCYCGIDHALFL
uniref:Uncharacterized protein n=1 Tax=Anguilla anguilla TaxID=7936 RepID=A0A0E9VZW8_ANGAN